MTNRLALEVSPYLLQHAHNPVDWYPWGEDAFARAKNLERLVLVSVGYAACHWCHVMEKECFAVPEIAEVMNRHLVCIKVDREERPDIDRVMMTALQALTGQGGWPLNIFLTPEGDPLIGGTYFPPQDRGSLPAWPRLIERLAGAWNHFDSRRDLTRRGLDLRLALAQHFSPVVKTSHTLLKAETIAESALTALMKRNDPHFGGFSGAPKFPMPVHLQFLLAWASLLGTEDPKVRTLLDPVIHTLKSMSRGGLCDQVGGGFHRYSTDDEWRVPHFEKMLNDNALLAATLAETVQMTGDRELSRATRRTLDYLLRDLRHPQGGFFTSEDADSPPVTGVAEKTEGAFYLWAWEELASLLGKKLPGMAKIFDLKPEGNFHDPHAPDSKSNILHGAGPGPTLPGVSPHFQNGEVDGFLDLLRQARDQRPRPDRDDKILTGWNGLALTALAKGFDALGEDRYLMAAKQTAEFLYAHLWEASTQTLFRRWRDGHRAIPAQAEDVSFLMAGLLDLFSSSGEARWLTWAHSLGEIFIRDFLDPASGRVFTTPPGSDPCLTLRPLDEGDHVDPSAASLAAESLAKLGRYFGRAEWEKTAGQMIQPLLALVPEQPLSFSRVLRTALFLEAPPCSRILQGSPQSPETKTLARALRKRFDPFSLLLFADGGETEKLLASHLPHLAALPPSDHPQIWPCEGHSCQPPLRTL